MTGRTTDARRPSEALLRATPRTGALILSRSGRAGATRSARAARSLALRAPAASRIPTPIPARRRRSLTIVRLGLRSCRFLAFRLVSGRIAAVVSGRRPETRRRRAAPIAHSRRAVAPTASVPGRLLVGVAGLVLVVGRSVPAEPSGTTVPIPETIETTRAIVLGDLIAPCPLLRCAGLGSSQ